ncbi:3-oxoacid CoA-transferase [Photobacterium profundum]|uniref:Acetate CoA-transferase YdiF n=1 Tax=Photobacterium profundum 3TCK TaxID=314280 RepID=Q1ZB15_9GAMM|nr:CoA-transferase [Photobacterium profundum]EAS45327.1 acetyl-coA:acetoacetyl-coA transferase alpha subunit [Photobacterium profundum 3TCK]PSV63481.1 3-oxoacid CoA-transferase [Photobacterium profundum]
MPVCQLTAEQAATWVQDGQSLMLGGFIGSVVPESIVRAIGERFSQTGVPQDLTLIFAAGQGDGKGRAANHLAQHGLVKRVIGGHWGLVPELQKMALDNEIEAYNLPQGVISHLLRDTAAGKPGTLTTTGLDTFVDPRLEGGKINAITKDDLVRIHELDGQEYLFYSRLPVDVAILRGTTADEDGNITMEDECLIVENLAAAQAARNQGGRVIVQVRRIVPSGTLDPHSIKIPGIFVDAIVLCQDETEHMQTFATRFSPEFVGRRSSAIAHIAKSYAKEKTAAVLDAKTLIARRAVMELESGAILNLGIGVPEYIATVAGQAGILDSLTLTIEPGAIGGLPASGLNFGASFLPEAIITQDQMFDFYDGGGIDQAFLGLAQCSRQGDINVSRFGNKLPGCGGFINISQHTKSLFFCGTFTANGLEVAVTDGQVDIRSEGRLKKFVTKVEQITFSASRAIATQQPVRYITERAVFRLDEKGLILEEIAPGINLERDILAQMAFHPIIDPDLKLMPACVFSPDFSLNSD